MWRQVLDFRAAPSTSFDVEIDRGNEADRNWRKSA
jgi:hypothetical protein